MNTPKPTKPKGTIKHIGDELDPEVTLPTKPNDEDEYGILKGADGLWNLSGNLTKAREYFLSEFEALITKREHLAELRGQKDALEELLIAKKHRKGTHFSTIIKKQLSYVQQQLEEAKSE